MIEINCMTAADIAFAVSMTEAEDWGYLDSDFRRLVALNPDGCFIGREGDEKIGIITSARYDSFAFLGCLIVKASRRQKGVGESLMKHALESLRAQGVDYFELDGVFPAVPLYRRLGFEDKYLSLRFMRPAGTGESAVAFTPHHFQAEDIIAFDRRNTGLNRGRLISTYIREFRDDLIVHGTDRCEGYAFSMPRADGQIKIGPLVASNPDIADVLLRQTIGRHAGRILLAGVPEANPGAASLFRRHGFSHKAPVLRMHLGKRRDYETGVYAIAAADKG